MKQSEYRKLMNVYCMSGVWCSYTHNYSNKIRGKNQQMSGVLSILFKEPNCLDIKSTKNS